MNFTIDLSLKEALKPELSRLNQDLEHLAGHAHRDLGDLLKYVLMGSGKRVRPALVFLGASLGTAPANQVHTIEMVVELIHIATLIHDDVIDQAALRRNQKTVAFEHGVDAAVLLGDHIYTYAFQLAAELGHPQILKLLAASTAVMCEGEINQLKSRFQFDLSEAEYFSFIEKKTAALFGVSARCGALLAGQPMPIQMALEKFGLHLGTAFQITDDVLDLTGQEDVVGKTLHTDLMNGKMTLPLIHYRNQIQDEEKKRHWLEQLKKPADYIDVLVKELKKAGSFDYVAKKAEVHIDQALTELSHLPTSPSRDHLTRLAQMLKNRKT